jgi:hypothetical protein
MMGLVWLSGGKERKVVFAFMKFAWKAVTAATFSFETSVFVNNTSTYESYPISDFRLRANFVFFLQVLIHKVLFRVLRNVTLLLLAAYVRGWLSLRPLSQGSANATAAEGENSLKMVLTSHCAQVGVTYFFTKTSNIDFTLECI